MRFCTTVIALVVFGLTAAVNAYQTRSFHVTPDQIRVVDGDTVEIDDIPYRLTGYDTPETFFAKCDFEKDLGQRAADRLQNLISGAETVRIEPTGRVDYHGRELAAMLVRSQDVGTTLISEGLARPYGGGQRAGWCN